MDDGFPSQVCGETSKLERVSRYFGHYSHCCIMRRFKDKYTYIGGRFRERS